MSRASWKIYEFIKGSSVFIRQFLLPNPFTGLENAEALNWISGFVLYPVTYMIVGIFYRERSEPAVGAFLYLLFYGIHTALIALAGVFNFNVIAIIVITILYLVVLFKIAWRNNRW